MQRQFILSILFVLGSFFHILIANAQILDPHPRAAQLMMNFSQLPLLEYGRQCVNMDLMRNTYVEHLLEIKNLNDDTVVDSIAIYNRWAIHGGYRCNPAKYKCQKLPDPGTLWTCRCPPLGEIGQQNVSEVKDPVTGKVTGCQYDSTTLYNDPIMLPDSSACKDIDPAAPVILPESYHNEIVCGIYKEDNVSVEANTSSQIPSIDSGLHYNEILCPDGKKCLIKEFDAKCTPENVKIIRDKWIYAGKFVRANRLEKWPPCVCSDAVEKELATSDPREDEVDRLFESISRAQHFKFCNRKDLERMKKCAQANWYLISQDIADKLTVLYREYAAQQAGPDCDTAKGLTCLENNCTCLRTHYLPGFSPEYPLTVNSEGYCQLDPGSDCILDDPGGFRCPDGYNCLIDRYNVTCTEENFEKANKKKMKGKEEIYIRRCLCSNFPIQSVLKDIDENGGLGKGSFGRVCNIHLILIVVIINASVKYF